MNFNELTNKGTDSGGDVIYHYNGQPFTGIIEEYSEGTLIGESEFTDGHRGGIQREYYSNGVLKEEFTIRFNKLEGQFRRWDEQGILLNESFWEDDEKNS